MELIVFETNHVFFYAASQGSVLPVNTSLYPSKHARMGPLRVFCGTVRSEQNAIIIQAIIK